MWVLPKMLIIGLVMYIATTVIMPVRAHALNAIKDQFNREYAVRQGTGQIQK